MEDSPQNGDKEDGLHTLPRQLEGRFFTKPTAGQFKERRCMCTAPWALTRTSPLRLTEGLHSDRFSILRNQWQF